MENLFKYMGCTKCEVKYYICMYNIMFSKIEDMERYLPFILCDCVMVMELEMSIHLKIVAT